MTCARRLPSPSRSEDAQLTERAPRHHASGPSRLPASVRMPAELTRRVRRVYRLRRLRVERSREASGDELTVGVVAHHEGILADDLKAVACVEALRPVVFAPHADP